MLMKIPIFPLNTVLFPGMPINLHIFEERYQLMIKRCIDERLPFGVVLIQKGVEALGPMAEPHLVGCTAQILHVEQLDAGRMNISCLGHERFQILSIDETSFPYLVGEVQMLPLPEWTSEESEALGDNIRHQFNKLIDILGRIRGRDFQRQEYPNNSVLLANMTVTLLQIPAHEKQTLLEAENVEQYFQDLLVILSREILLLETIASKTGPMLTRVFSKN